MTSGKRTRKGTRAKKRARARIVKLTSLATVVMLSSSGLIIANNAEKAGKNKDYFASPKNQYKL